MRIRICFRRRTKSVGEEEVEESGGLFPRRQPALVRLRDGVAEEDQPIVVEGAEVRQQRNGKWNGTESDPNSESMFCSDSIAPSIHSVGGVTPATAVVVA